MNEKQTIICGVYHEMSEVEKSDFINMMSEDGKYNVIFDDNNIMSEIIKSSLPFLCGGEPNE